jgi:HEAT repeat protein
VRAGVPLPALGRVAALDLFLRGVGDEDAGVRQESVLRLAEYLKGIDTKEWEPGPGEPESPARAELASRIRACAAALGELARDPDEALRLLAVDALVSARCPACVPELLRAFGDPSAKVRTRVAASINGWDNAGRREAVPYLARLLQAPEADVRETAASALGSIGREASGAVPALLAAMTDPVAGVRQAAVFGMGMLHAAAGPAVPALAKALRDPDAQVRWAACASLWMIDTPCEEAIDPLLERARSEKPQERREALLALGSVGPGVPRVRIALMNALEDRDANVRSAALDSLRGHAPVDTESAALAVLRESSGIETHNQAALAALERMGFDTFLAAYARLVRSDEGKPLHFDQPSWLKCVPETAPRRIRELARDPDPALRLLAIRLAVGRLPEDECAAVLLDGLKDPDPSVREGTIGWAASRSNTEPRSAVLDFLTHADPQVRKRAALALWAKGEVPAQEEASLLRCLRDADPDVRECALDILAKAKKVEPSTAVAALVEVLSDPSEENRSYALRVLSGFGRAASGASPRLTTLLDDDDPDVRLGAAVALLCAGANDARAVDRITADLKDPGKEQRHDAIQGLCRIGLGNAHATRLLEEVLRTGDSLERREILVSMGDMGPAALPYLVRALTGPIEDETEPAARSMAKIGPPSVPSLLRALGDPRAVTRKWAGRSLGWIGAGARDAVPALVTGLRDANAEVRADCARALGRIGLADSSVVRALGALESDPDEEVRDEAERALEELRGG